MYGSMYVTGGSTLQATTATPALLTAFATLGPCASTKGGNLSVVPLLASNQFTVKGIGVYRIAFLCSVKGSAAAVITFRARFAGVTVISNIVTAVEVIAATVGEQLGAAMEGIYIPTADGTITIWVESSNSINTTVTNAQFVVQRID